MSVSPTTNNANNAPSNTSTGNSANDLLNSFMNLLIAQMKNQDPTNPMDNNQLTAQLAQFQTAAGIEKLNTTVGNVGSVVLSMQQMNAADWVGRTVLIKGKPVVSTVVDGNRDITFNLQSKEGSEGDKVTVTLTDDQGNAYVGTIKDPKPGVNIYTLDDITDFKPTNPGAEKDTTFTVTYSATTAKGDTIEIDALKSAKVESVSFGPGSAVLHLGVDGTINMFDVFHIK